MATQIQFTDGDEELVKEIKKFQKSQDLPSFGAAVRKLCLNGLHISDVVQNMK